MKTDAEKFADAAFAAYTAYTEINAACRSRKGAHPATIAKITAAAFEAIAIAFDANATANADADAYEVAVANATAAEAAAAADAATS